MKQRAIDIQSNDNTLFCTSQCNNRCVMCCQPPLKVDDIDELFEENLQRIRTAPKDLPLIGITGGEPTLLGEKLVVLIKEIRTYLPSTEIQLLSNGRRFADIDYTRRIAETGGDVIYVGVELHSDYYKDHDTIAGNKGAYQETMKGLYNLATCGVPVEIRIIMCALNYKRFYHIAEFIHRNLPFVGWIAFMGMEDIGWATKNRKYVWIEPLEYQQELLRAVKYLADWNYNVSIFNVPLCLLPKYLHGYARKSISDWKKNYEAVCEGCIMRDECCGFFSTSKHLFEGIAPFNMFNQNEA